jgi:hypothetical protein
VTILLFPTHLHYEYRPVESLYIFQNLPLFAALYSVWMATLLLLIFSMDDKKGHLEGMILAAVFGLVFWGFWAIIAPNRTGDGISLATSVNYVSTKQTISGHIAYSDFPGLYTLGSLLQQITGMETAVTTTALSLVEYLILSSLLYAIFVRSLRSSLAATVATVLLVQGCWIWSRATFFYPGFLGFIFLAAFLVLTYRKEGPIFGTNQDRVMAFILLAAATVTHFVSSVIMFFILLGVYSVQAASSKLFEPPEYRRNLEMINWPILGLFIIVPLVWELYWAVSTFGGLTQYIPKLINEFSEGTLFRYVTTLGGMNLGGQAPLWASLVRWFWLGLIYGVSSLLAVATLIKIRRLNIREKRELGTLIGIAIFGITSFFASPGGVEGQRLLMYLPVVLIPIMLRYVFDLRASFKMIAVGILVCLFFVLSLPSFLAHNNTISTDAFYPQEFSAGKYVLRIYGDTDILSLFSGGQDTDKAIRYFVISSTWHGESPLVGRENVATVWQELDKVITEFENSQSARSVYIFSERTKTPYQHFFGIESDDPEWVEVEQRLEKNNMVYTNAFVQLYMPAIRGSE